MSNIVEKKSFTMIEILVVASIIIVLMGLLIPAASTVLRKANVNKTKTAVRTLQMAIRQYETTYGILPFTDTFSVDTLITTGANYDTLLTTLSALDVNLNPRLIKFIELDKNNDYKDAWDNDFFVALDLNYDGFLDDSVVHGFGQISTSLVIWSKGRDELENATDNNSVNDDNINSWD